MLSEHKSLGRTSKCASIRPTKRVQQALTIVGAFRENKAVELNLGGLI
jgi:hypothetical protein